MMAGRIGRWTGDGVSGRGRERQRWRRHVVIGLYGGYAALATATHWGSVGEDGWRITVTALLGGVWLLALVRLVRSAHSLANDPDERLDERQRAVRDRAYLGAYRVVAAILLLGSVWLWIALDGRTGWLPGANGALAIAGGAILLTLTLPAAFVAWSEPDGSEDRRDGR